MKMKKYLFMLTALFTAATGFTACSSEDDWVGADRILGRLRLYFRF
jgi:hypothetical protein